MKRIVNYLIFGVILLYLIPTIVIVMMVVLVQRFVIQYTKQSKLPEFPYVFKTKNTYVYELALPELKGFHFIHSDQWFHIHWDDQMQHSKLTIQADKHPNGYYPWDGCSPKIELFDLIIGTPDGKLMEDGLPVTFRASLIHDVLYENRKALEKRISRKATDQLFYRILKEDGFKLAWPYYASVRMFGWSYWYSY